MLLLYPKTSILVDSSSKNFLLGIKYEINKHNEEFEKHVSVRFKYSGMMNNNAMFVVYLRLKQKFWFTVARPNTKLWHISQNSKCIIILGLWNASPLLRCILSNPGMWNSLSPSCEWDQVGANYRTMSRQVMSKIGHVTAG